ncbi:ABC transporter permease [Serratia sp. M24T3]|uniref:ABC transporter permease n=1 Tax=Serratia sp. M24T3 TaxID=932213 RepID=UPI0002E2AC51|nr:ABC transporter permease [Serratia sp. M24T3]
MSDHASRTSGSVILKSLPVELPPARRLISLPSLRHTIRILVPLIVLLIWQLSSSVVSQHGFQLPSPGDVLNGFIELWKNEDVQSAIPASLARAGTGLFFGLVIGLVLGIANGLFKISEQLFDSSMQIVRIIPFIAVIPLFVVWFGIGEEMKIILIALACSFPVYINTYTAVKLVDNKLVEVGETFGLSYISIIFQIIIPSAFPTILIGIRYAMSTSLLALVVAEQVNSKSGIGNIIYIASNALRIDLIMVGIIIYAVLGIIVDITMRLVEFYSMPWLNRSK